MLVEKYKFKYLYDKIKSNYWKTQVKQINSNRGRESKAWNEEAPINLAVCVLKE
jgi:hypothetical protein